MKEIRQQIEDNIINKNNFYIYDKPNFLMSKFLLELISNSEIIVDSVNEDFFIYNQNNPVLSYRNGELIGLYKKQMEVMLLAISIHEVDSFEWIHYSQEYRNELLNNAALKLNSNSKELMHFIKLWIS